MVKFKIKKVYNGRISVCFLTSDSFNECLLDSSRIARKESENNDFLYMEVLECTDPTMDNARLYKVARFYNINSQED